MTLVERAEEARKNPKTPQQLHRDQIKEDHVNHPEQCALSEGNEWCPDCGAMVMGGKVFRFL